jgi:hypothetical protein
MQFSVSEFHLVHSTGQYVKWGREINTQKILSTEYKTAVSTVLHAKYKKLFILYCPVSDYENIFTYFCNT